MHRYKNGHRARLWLLAALAMMLGACATTGPKPSNGAEKRAQERLDYIFKGDLGAAYGYLSPGYRSGTSSLDWQRAFLTRRAVWEGGEVTGSECSGDTCKVSITIDYAVYGALPGVSRMALKEDIHETWLLSAGEWYLVP